MSTTTLYKKIREEMLYGWTLRDISIVKNDWNSIVVDNHCFDSPYSGHLRTRDIELLVEVAHKKCGDHSFIAIEAPPEFPSADEVPDGWKFQVKQAELTFDNLEELLTEPGWFYSFIIGPSEKWFIYLCPDWSMIAGDESFFSHFLESFGGLSNYLSWADEAGLLPDRSNPKDREWMAFLERNTPITEALLNRYWQSKQA